MLVSKDSPRGRRGQRHRARTAKHGCPMPRKDWLGLRETKKQRTRAKGKQVDGQATARDALSIQPRSGQVAKRIGQQAPIPSDRCWSSMGRETLARPSLHLRWRKRCCAKGLVRGAPSGEARFCASSVLVLYSVHRVLAVLFWRSPLVIPVWHHTSGSTAGSSHATKQPRYRRGTTPQYADAAVPCTGTIAPASICRPVGGGGCGCTSKEMDPWILLSNHARSTASSASPPGPPVQGYFRIPGLALWPRLGPARLLLSLERVEDCKLANI